MTDINYIEVLKTSVQTNEGLLIVGGSGSGKTSLINELLQYVPSNSPLKFVSDDPLELNLRYTGDNVDYDCEIYTSETVDWEKLSYSYEDEPVAGYLFINDIVNPSDEFTELFIQGQPAFATFQADSAKTTVKRLLMSSYISKYGKADIRAFFNHVFPKMVFLKRNSVTAQREIEIYEIKSVDGDGVPDLIPIYIGEHTLAL